MKGARHAQLMSWLMPDFFEHVLSLAVEQLIASPPGEERGAATDRSSRNEKSTASVTLRLLRLRAEIPWTIPGDPDQAAGSRVLGWVFGSDYRVVLKSVQKII